MIDTAVNPVSNELTIERARDWFNNKSARLKGDSLGKKNNDRYYWESAKKLKDKNNKDIIIVPVIEDDPNWYTIGTPDETSDMASALRRGDSPVDLVITLDDKGKEIGYYSTIIQDNKNLKSNKYFKKEILDGYIVLKDLSKKTIDIAIVEKGKVKDTFSNISNNRKKKGARDQATLCYDVYSQACVEGYGCGPLIWIDYQCTSGTIDNGGGVLPNIDQFQTLYSGGGSFDAYQNIPEFNDFLSQLNAKEYLFFAARPWLIPQARNNSLLAEAALEKFYCMSGGMGDGQNPNAYKHIAWSMLNCLTFGKSTAMEIGNNHELDDDNSIYKQIDLANNNVGYYLYSNKHSQIMQYNDQAHRSAAVLLLALDRVQNGGAFRASADFQTMIPTNGDQRCN